MKILWIAFILGFGGLAFLLWGSDQITLQGERTIYTAACESGAWNGLHCTGRLAPADMYRFRSSRARNEVAYWIAGSTAPSGKLTACKVKDRDNWTCNIQADQPPSIAYELARGRPTSHGSGATLPFHGVTKWKWWALNVGIPGITEADFDNASVPSLPSQRTP
jgi:hypothetical protein